MGDLRVLFDGDRDPYTNDGFVGVEEIQMGYGVCGTSNHPDERVYVVRVHKSATHGHVIHCLDTALQMRPGLANDHEANEEPGINRIGSPCPRCKCDGAIRAVQFAATPE